MGLKEDLRHNDVERKRARSTLAYLIRVMPLNEVVAIVGTIMAERNDLRAKEMQPFARKVNDMTWPLVDLDHEYDDDRKVH